MNRKYIIGAILALLFIPLQAQVDNMFTEMGRSLDLHMEKESMEEKDINTEAKELFRGFIALELLLLDTAFEITENTINLPRYLSSLHILDIKPSDQTASSETNPFSYAFNFSHTFENTFFPWLNVVDYDYTDLHSPQQIFKGFGPQISM